MKISDLVEKLQALQAEHGDLEMTGGVEAYNDWIEVERGESLYFLPSPGPHFLVVFK